MFFDNQSNKSGFNEVGSPINVLEACQKRSAILSMMTANLDNIPKKSLLQEDCQKCYRRALSFEVK